MGFAGIVPFHGTTNDPGAEERLARALVTRTSDEVVVHRFDTAFLVQRRDEVLAGLANGQDQPTRRAAFIGSGRLDNREELAKALEIGPTESASLSDITIINRMFERWGDAGLARCLGGFSFACWNRATQQLTLGRDCVGQRVVFFHRTEHFAVFSDILAVLLALPEVPREIDEAVLADFLALAWHEPRRTLYRGIERTPSRSLVTIDTSGARHRIYWQPNLDAYSHLRRDEDYIEQARTLFDQAVMCTISGKRKVAISLSGGLDSSAVAATVARLGCTEQIDCYTNVALPDWQVELGPDQYRDERDKVEALGRMYPQLNLHFLAPTEPHPHYHDERRAFAVTPLPILAPAQAAWTMHLGDAALRDGHATLLVGARGNAGLSWEGCNSLSLLLCDGTWASFLSELFRISRQSGRNVVRVFAANVLLPVGPEWLRRLAHRLRGRDPDDIAHYCALNPDFVAEHKLLDQWRKHGFDNWFQSRGWSSVPSRIHHTFDNVAPHGDGSGARRELGGLDFRDPHGDRRVLEFALAVPESLYRRNGVSRAFARAVFADRLPPEILHEHRRGAAGGGPWFRMLNTRRQDFAAEIERFENSALASRLLDLPRLKRLLNDWPKDENSAQHRQSDYNLAFARGMHVGRFIKWVEGGNG